MADLNRVLIVEDDKFAQKYLRKSLASHYEVETAEDGDQALDLITRWSPDLILLDVELPGRNGYELCDHIKRQPESASTPVIFLSSHSSVRERMLGYEVGADDYLVKPCSEEILLAKLDRMRDYVNTREKLRSSYESAQLTALEAITTSAELGKAVRFIERSYLAPSMEKLARELTDILRDLQLSCSLMFIGRSSNYYASTHSTEVAPLEQELLQMLHTEERFVDFGCRTQINYPRVALLVKNMPLEDRPRYGRLKDILPFALGATDAKVRVIDAEQSFKQQNLELADAVDSVRQSLESIGTMLNDNQKQVSEIMTALNTNLSLELHKMGLEEDQENYVLDQFYDASQGISQTLVRGSNILDTMEVVVHQLENLAINQHQIINETLTIPQADSDIPDSRDIELF